MNKLYGIVTKNISMRYIAHLFEKDKPGFAGRLLIILSTALYCWLLYTEPKLRTLGSFLNFLIFICAHLSLIWGGRVQTNYERQYKMLSEEDRKIEESKMKIIPILFVAIIALGLFLAVIN
jgi:hypothetical protein